VVSKINTLARCAMTLAAGLAATACATLPEPSAPMAVGAAAVAPRGYVEFCERQPSDCGASEAELATLKATRADRAAQVAASSMTFDWSAVFAPQEGSTTTAAVGPAATATPAMLVRYDWSQVFAAQLQPTGGATAAAAPSQKPELTARLWAQITRTNDQVNRSIAQKTDAEAYGRDELWSTPIADGARYGDCEDYVLEKRRALVAAGVPADLLSIAVVNTSKGDSHAVLLVDTASGEYVLDNLTPWVLPWTKTAYQWRERQVAGSPARWAMAAGVQLQPAAPSLLLASLR
jgi:predicted transglutaminase-like cysteine proteinase